MELVVCFIRLSNFGLRSRNGCRRTRRSASIKSCFSIWTSLDYEGDIERDNIFIPITIRHQSAEEEIVRAAWPNLHSANKCLPDNRNWWCRTWAINLWHPKLIRQFCLLFFLSGAKLETRRMMMIWARTLAAVIKSFFAVDFDFQWTKANLLRKGLDRNVECRRLLKIRCLEF